MEAAIDLHRTIGPAATTVSEIAERAGVGRVAVYRHFPDELALARACSGLYFERHPLADPSPWRRITDPRERLRTALRETYAYHRANEPMITHVIADARDHPVMAPYHEQRRRAAEALLPGWRLRGHDRVGMRAALSLALSFDTWRVLARDHGLTDEEAAGLVVRLTRDCGHAGGGPAS